MAGKPTPLSPEALDAALNALLADYPTAFVAAINADGVFVPMPPSVPLAGQQVLKARSMFDLVVSEDCGRVISTWERARETGGATAEVRLALDPGRPAVIHYLDARARHGVYVGIVVGADAAALTGLSEIRPAPPRMARVRKNEVAVFLEVDEATTKILGWTAEEMVGLRSLDFVHPEDQDRAIQSWMGMLSEPGTVQPPARLRHRRADGSWAWFEVTNHNGLADPDRGYVLAEMFDISDEMAAQDALRERMRLFTALAEFAAAVNAIREPERLVATLGDAVSSILPSDTAVITTLDRGDGRYRVRSARGLAPGAVGAIIQPGEGTAGRAISERAVIVREHKPGDQYSAALRDYQLRDTSWALGVPLINEDRVLGVISVGRFDADANSRSPRSKCSACWVRMRRWPSPTPISYRRCRNSRSTMGSPASTTAGISTPSSTMRSPVSSAAHRPGTWLRSCSTSIISATSTASMDISPAMPCCACSPGSSTSASAPPTSSRDTVARSSSRYSRTAPSRRSSGWPRKSAGAWRRGRCPGRTDNHCGPR